MRFIAKNSNLYVVLQPGLSAQPLTGTPAVPTVSVRFRDGVADVTDQDLIDKMLRHPGFGGDFISVEENTADPYSATRQETEPQHVITEMMFGTPVGRKVAGGKVALPPEVQKLVEAMAAERVKAILPGAIEAALKTIITSHEAEKASEIENAETPAEESGKAPTVAKKAKKAAAKDGEPETE